MKRFKKPLGIVMVSIPFAALFAAMAMDAGIVNALLVFGGAIALILLFWYGIGLIRGEI